MINLLKKSGLSLVSLVPVFFLLAPILLVFQNFFGEGHLVYGDALYLYPEALRNGLNGPLAWVYRGTTFGGVNNYLFIYPIMYFYSLLSQVFGFNNDVLIRIVFYFPAVLFAAFSSYYLARYLKYAKTVCFFASLLYVLNTYFLMIIDGGQVGVALAYGLFPLVLWRAKCLVDKFNLRNLITSSISMLLLTTVDPRMAVMVFIVFIIWIIIEILSGVFEGKGKNVLYWLLSLMVIFCLNGYWIFPFLRLNGSAFILSTANLPQTTLLHAISLHSPHWPSNIFGQTENVEPYFFFIPIFILTSYVLVRNKKTLSLLLMFLVFAFLAKGMNVPFGQVYQFILKLPFGSFLRDSTKFFVPLVLFSGILVGLAVEALSLKVKNKILAKGIIIVSYLYILFLISPVILGKLNFVLSSHSSDNEIQNVSEVLERDNSFFRSLWFPEKHPLGFETNNKAAIDAKNLISLRPFLSLNVGSYDLYNFMRQGNWQDWFKLFGIKYLVLSGDQRIIEYKENELADWTNFKEYLATQSGILRLDKAAKIPLYQLEETAPHLFGSNFILAVIGGDDIYETIEKRLPFFSRVNQPFVFLEDGLTDPNFFEYKNPQSIKLVFNKKTKMDLQMSYLCKSFVSPVKASKTQWKVWTSQDYLEWKYQLLIRGVNFKEFDYGAGIALSTVQGETITFKLPVVTKGEYYVVSRTMGDINGGGLLMKVAAKEYEVKQITDGNLQWNVFGPVLLKRGKSTVKVVNRGELNIINLVGLVAREDYEEAGNMTASLLRKYQTLDISVDGDMETLISLLKLQKYYPLEVKENKDVSFTIQPNKKGFWIILTDNYHPFWKLYGGGQIIDSLPFYSAINGFYYDPNWKDIEIVFGGQEDLQWGIWITLISALASLVILLMVLKSEDEKNIK
jgi:hypothetical protein